MGCGVHLSELLSRGTRVGQEVKGSLITRTPRPLKYPLIGLEVGSQSFFLSLIGAKRVSISQRSSAMLSERFSIFLSI